ncbi:hypothetical protein BDN70DRAFT_516834 [Pholiota conissans]|uniref:Uncharacterized protein n=1 Tax=Pholiota conissans TaxID=109636 RepID=A0A9P6CMN4_9AGAR|nr:hypothetical protein BDN70DRAFT_516834 [Pholiota conissans]
MGGAHVKARLEGRRYPCAWKTTQTHSPGSVKRCQVHLSIMGVVATSPSHNLRLSLFTVLAVNRVPALQVFTSQQLATCLATRNVHTGKDFTSNQDIRAHHRTTHLTHPGDRTRTKALHHRGRSVLEEAEAEEDMHPTNTTIIASITAGRVSISPSSLSHRTSHRRHRSYHSIRISRFGMPARTNSSSSYDAPGMYTSMMRSQPPNSAQGSGPGGGSGDPFAAFLDADEQSRQHSLLVRPWLGELAGLSIRQQPQCIEPQQPQLEQQCRRWRCRRGRS